MQSSSMKFLIRATAFLTCLAVVVAVPVFAQRADDSSRASKNGKVESKIGDVLVVLEFGRPNVKDREIWDGLVPYGRVWRTGADEATTITFSKDVMVQGEHLMAGTYGLFTVPGAEEWLVVFNNVPNQWGAFNYDESKDALRVAAKPREGEFVESLDFVIEGSEIVLRWEKLELPISVSGH